MLDRARHPFRALGALLALGLFLAGTNFCAVSQLAESLGYRVPACATTALAAPRVPAGSTCEHCAHGASRAPRAAAPAPCCIALVPVTAPDAHAHVAPASLLAVLPAAPAALADAGTIDRLPAALAPDPPGAPPRDPSAARAPPLL